tara:strand:+ start:93 stop:269 length:177 start_codon:yes stop_codon:yes gene_type:complete
MNCDYCNNHSQIKDWHHLYYPNGKIYYTWADIIPCPKCNKVVDTLNDSAAYSQHEKLS